MAKARLREVRYNPLPFLYGKAPVYHFNTKGLKMSNLYQGKRRFTQEQVTFMAECLLLGALDMIECGLPTSITWEERNTGKHPKALTGYEQGALESVGEALSILFAQLTRDGMGCYDALVCAGNFDDAVETMMREAWKDQGKSYNEDPENYVIPHYPDCRKHAEDFVATMIGQFPDVLENEGDIPRVVVKVENGFVTSARSDYHISLGVMDMDEILTRNMDMENEPNLQGEYDMLPYDLLG